MNIPFIIAVLTKIIFGIIRAEPLPDRWWSAKYGAWHRHHDVTEDECFPGQCVQSWKCPEYALSEKAIGPCAYWSHGPWVCCTLNYSKETERESSQHTTKIPRTKLYPNRVIKYDRKQRTSTTIENYKKRRESWNTTPCSEDAWGRCDKKLQNSYSRDTHTDYYDRLNSGSSQNKRNQFQYADEWKRTTNYLRNQRTTSNPRETWTTKRKSSTSESRIIFPTEISWSRKTTKRPAFTTFTRKKTTNALHRTTAKPWIQPTRRTYTTSASWNNKPAVRGIDSPKVTRSWNTRKDVQTRPNNNRDSNSGEKRNKDSDRSASWNPYRNLTTQPRNIYTPNPKSSSTGNEFTRRNRVTTPLPDINIHYCGLRDRILQNNRYRRNHNTNSEISDSGFRNSSRRNSSGSFIFQRIVGGKEVIPYSWPWVAALYKVSRSGVNRFLSAGSLINEYFVLTVAHSFTRNDIRSSSYTVMLGTHNAEDAVAQYRVISVIQHPQYERRFYYHDIALLRLEKPVIFNDFVMPVCLPSPNVPLLLDRDLIGKTVTVMGWGDESFGGKTSHFLKEATFSIISRRVCNASYVRVASNRFPRGITGNMLCAGDPNGGKDACQGDSGGPLMSIEQGRYTQVGIVSFGYQCGDKEFPGVYTKVAPYLSWIAENTESIVDYAYDYNR